MSTVRTALVIGAGIAGPVAAMALLKPASRQPSSRLTRTRRTGDLPAPSSAFAAYESLRRARVEKITARGAKINHSKTPGPLARKLMPLLLPILFKTMNVEKTMGPEQRYTIDWDAPVESAALVTA